MLLGLTAIPDSRLMGFAVMCQAKGSESGSHVRHNRLGSSSHDSNKQCVLCRAKRCVVCFAQISATMVARKSGPMLF